MDNVVTKLIFTAVTLQEIAIFSHWGDQFSSKFDIVSPKTPLYKGMVVRILK